jgi:hypothetical protein
MLDEKHTMKFVCRLARASFSRGLGRLSVYNLFPVQAQMRLPGCVAFAISEKPFIIWKFFPGDKNPERKKIGHA